MAVEAREEEAYERRMARFPASVEKAITFGQASSLATAQRKASRG